MTTTQSTHAVAPWGASQGFLRLAMKRLLADRDALLARSARPVVDYERQATTGSGETDYINVETERQLVALLDAQARQALEAVERALARVDDGTYGLGVRCGVPIGVERLLALPRVESCIGCQRVDQR